MNKLDKILFSGRTHTTASRRDGSAHGTLDIRLSSAGEVAHEELFEGVPPHPIAERLFAGAWSACYSGALALTAAQMKIKLPADLAVGIEVDLGQAGNAHFLQARRPCARDGTGGRREARAWRPRDLPLLEGHAGQHRRRPQRRDLMME